MLFHKKSSPPGQPDTAKRNWHPLNDQLSGAFVFLDDIRWTEDGICLILSQAETKARTFVKFQGHPYSYRVTQESYYFNPFDCYDNADDLSYKDHKIFFTQESAYLDRFYQQSDMLQKEQDRLYHIQIITEDMIVDVIDDQLPIVFAES